MENKTEEPMLQIDGEVCSLAVILGFVLGLFIGAILAIVMYGWVMA